MWGCCQNSEVIEEGQETIFNENAWSEAQPVVVTGGGCGYDVCEDRLTMG